MLTPQEARRRFAHTARLPDGQINLFEAALLISAGQSSSAQVELAMAHLTSLANRVRLLLNMQGLTEPQEAPLETVRTINKVLFEEEGFQGNSEDYYDPENSFLDRVLARRTGIPITLSLLYMEVARQVDFPMRGIGLPGHFVAGYWSRQGGRIPALIVDPFNGGRILSADDCAARVHAAYGDDVRFTPEWLQPMTKRQILSRVLNNLKHIYISMEQYREAVRVVDMMLAVQPEAVWELKERGLLYYRTGVFVLALADLRRYLKLTPEGDESGLLKYYVDLLQRLVVAAN